ncbi:hypothetical protein CEV34_1189 [Brucella pseudogrignonensis]|uniref:Uncharacterized protein n=1 Tax=Brucella pseudogrignonensis TaxID=419475 RepID=A0A256GN64_9HYPH|nr:hypothetical protein CEV34_1189 [Brucella pseudogrignonensis]
MPVNSPCREGDNNCSEQQIHEWIPELGKQALPDRNRRHRTQFVGTIFCQPACCFRSCQTALGVTGEFVYDFLRDAERVVIRCLRGATAGISVALHSAVPSVISPCLVSRQAPTN